MVQGEVSLWAEGVVQGAERQASLKQSCDQAMRILYKWLNRRSQRRSYNWEGFRELLRDFQVEQPRIVGRPKAMQAALVA